VFTRPTTRVLGAALALSLACGGGAGAQTAPPAQDAPFTLDGCTVIDGSATFSLFVPSGRARMDVTYRNHSTVAASEVRTALVVDGVPLWVYDDVATFAPATKIRRLAEIPYMYFPLRATPTCAIAQVRYVDGTTWTNPTLDVTQSLRQTPDSRIAVERCEPVRKGLDTHTNVTFVNQATKAASRVAISMWAGERVLERYEKIGTFAPGIPIAWQSYSDENLFPVRALQNQCRVDAVDYADGTSWANPELHDAFWTPQTDGSRIDVLRCATDQFVNINGRQVISHVADGVAVDYRNAAAVAARRVDFAVVAFGTTVGVARESGTFAPGVVISHTLALPHDVFPLGTALPTCSVRRVEYADGTSWVQQ
jgi:hypothetical protein